MGFRTYVEIGECSYCSRKAEVFFIRMRGFRYNWRFFANLVLGNIQGLVMT